MADMDNTDPIVHSSEVQKLHKKWEPRNQMVKKDYGQIILNLDQMNYLIT